MIRSIISRSRAVTVVQSQSKLIPTAALTASVASATAIRSLSILNSINQSNNKWRFTSNNSPSSSFRYYTSAGSNNNPSPIPRASDMHATTILSVRKGLDVVIIGDGQVSLGSTVMKPNARKVRVIANGKVVSGFAGSTADCFALLDLLEKKLDEYPGQLLRSAVELAKMWRTDKFLRHLEAWMICVDKQNSITVTGNGDVISEPNDGVIGIGSGGVYAVAAARALMSVADLSNPPLSARQIALRAMTIASEICVYTNNNFVIEQFTSGELITGNNKLQLEDDDRTLRMKWEDKDRKERNQIERQQQIDAVKAAELNKGNTDKKTAE